MPIRIPSLVLVGLTLLAASADSAGGQAPAVPITVFAAADLGPPFAQLVPQYKRETGRDVTLVLGSTGILTQQIRNGAPADVFFAANDSYVRQLSAELLTIEPTRRLYARGRIATITLKSTGLRIDSLVGLARSDVRRVAIANPLHAPYGTAAREALEAAGVWKDVEPKLIYGENVQQAAQFVRSGSAEAGIVARSVADTPDLNWTLVDERLHTPLNQVAVVLARTRQRAASTAFIEFVNAAQGRLVMRRFGFLLPGESF